MLSWNLRIFKDLNNVEVGARCWELVICLTARFCKTNNLFRLPLLVPDHTEQQYDKCGTIKVVYNVLRMF